MPECQRCEAHVTEDFTRVFGTDDNEVYGCLDCLVAHELAEGEGGRIEEPDATGSPVP
jgi:hypothetical protein